MLCYWVTGRYVIEVARRLLATWSSEDNWTNWGCEQPSAFCCWTWNSGCAKVASNLNELWCWLVANSFVAKQVTTFTLCEKAQPQIPNVVRAARLCGESSLLKPGCWWKCEWRYSDIDTYRIKTRIVRTQSFRILEFFCSVVNQGMYTSKWLGYCHNESKNSPHSSRKR